MGDPGGDVYGFQSEGLVLCYDCIATVQRLFCDCFVSCRVLFCLGLWLPCIVVVLFCLAVVLSCPTFPHLGFCHLALSGRSPQHGGSCVSSSQGRALRAHGRGLVFVFAFVFVFVFVFVFCLCLRLCLICVCICVFVLSSFFSFFS